MKKLALVLASAVMATVLVAPQGATAAPPTTLGGDTVPIEGQAMNAAGELVTFAGTVTLQRFVAENGELAAVATIAGTGTNTVTGATEAVSDRQTLDVLDISATCQILHLELGPLDLDVLGLVIHLDQVVLDITAEAGPGNLLGNLLCAVAGLLDSNAPLSQLLNQLIALLNNILGGL